MRGHLKATNSSMIFTNAGNYHNGMRGQCIIEWEAQQTSYNTVLLGKCSSCQTQSVVSTAIERSAVFHTLLLSRPYPPTPPFDNIRIPLTQCFNWYLNTSVFATEVVKKTHKKCTKYGST